VAAVLIRRWALDIKLQGGCEELLEYFLRRDKMINFTRAMELQLFLIMGVF